MPQSTGLSLPAMRRATDRAIELPSEGSLPSRYSSITPSSFSASVSRRLVAALAGGLDVARGDVLGVVLLALGRSPRQTRARMPTRSTTPGKSASAPIGSWRTSGVASRRSTIMSTQRKNSAPDAVELVDEADPGDAVAGRPGARPSRTAARHPRHRRTRRPRRRGRAASARPRR